MDDERASAWLYRRYGGIDVLELGPLARPRPGAADVVVRVVAVALNPKDALFRKGRFKIVSGRRFPKFVGVDFAGEVVAAGARSDLAAGTRVFGALDEWRFVRGTVATVVLAHAEEVAPMPEGLAFTDAASLPLAGLTALQALRDLPAPAVRPGAGWRVVVNGAAGGVGTLAIQIGVALGAEVTAICGSRNLDFCRSLGAGDAFAHDVGDPLAGHTWDVFFDVFGNRSFGAVRRNLSPSGVYISTVPSLVTALDAARTLLSRRRARPVRVKARRGDLVQLAALWRDGKLRPVIDRIVGMAEVPEAFRHLETKHARGKIVVRVCDG